MPGPAKVVIMSPSDPPSQTPQASRSNSRGPGVIAWLIIALLLWGIWLAVGTYLYRFNSAEQDPLDTVRAWRRGLLVLGCTGAFLTLWLVALAARKRRKPS